MCVFIKHDMVLLNTTNIFFFLLTFQVISENQRKTQNWRFLSSAIVQILLFSLGRQSLPYFGAQLNCHSIHSVKSTPLNWLCISQWVFIQKF